MLSFVDLCFKLFIRASKEGAFYSLIVGVHRSSFKYFGILWSSLEFFGVLQSSSKFLKVPWSSLECLEFSLSSFEFFRVHE